MTAELASKMDMTEMGMAKLMCGVSVKERQPRTEPMYRGNWGCDEKRHGEVAWTRKEKG